MTLPAIGDRVLIEAIVVAHGPSGKDGWAMPDESTTCLVSAFGQSVWVQTKDIESNYPIIVPRHINAIAYEEKKEDS